jgi:hypothetical protein
MVMVDGIVIKDGTGAPATVHAMGQVFECDYRGDVVIKRVSGDRTTPAGLRTAMTRAKGLYLTWLQNHAGLGWIKANCALYR